MAKPKKPKKKYFFFMDKYWSIDPDKFKEMDDIIEEHDYVPDVEDKYWGTKMLKSKPRNVRIHHIEPDNRRPRA